MIIPTTCSSSPGMDASKAMTGTVRAAHKRREGAVGVSSREAASEGHPGAVPLKAVGGNGHPPLPGHECAGAPAKLGGTTECYGGFGLWGGGEKKNLGASPQWDKPAMTLRGTT